MAEKSLNQLNQLNSNESALLRTLMKGNNFQWDENNSIDESGRVRIHKLKYS